VGLGLGGGGRAGGVILQKRGRTGGEFEVRPPVRNLSAQNNQGFFGRFQHFGGGTTEQEPANF